MSTSEHADNSSTELTAEHFTGGWTVRDVDDGHSLWWPDEDADAEIDGSEDPAATAVKICREQPERGTWHC